MGAIEINTSSSTCRKCGTAYGRLKGYFPVSYSYLYKGTGYLPYCKDCVDNMYTAYLLQCKDPRKAVRQMCRKLDLYWNEKIYDAVERQNSTRSTMTAYITKVNAVKLANKCYDDTLIEEGVLWIDPKDYMNFTPSDLEQQDTPDARSENEQAYVDPEVIEFWGADFAPEFILKLDKRYKDWTEDFEQLDKGSISLFKQICILEETISRDAAAGRAVDKNMNTLNTLLGSANLKPVQKDNAMSSAAESSPMGVWIRRFENERPIPEPDPELRDVDKIVHYIQVFFLGHLAKMLGKNEVYSKMYEDEIARLRVEKPDISYEYDDDESFFEAAFSNVEDGDDV